MVSWLGVVLAGRAGAEPYHGSNPGWLGNLTTNRKTWALNTRMTYVSGRRNFSLNEFGVSQGLRNGLSGFQTVVGGNARQSVGQLAVPAGAVEELSHDQQHPAVADDVEPPCQRAVLTI